MEEIGKSLPIILRGYLRRERPHVVEILAPLWLQVAGVAIAQHSRPTGFSAGTLTLETSSEIWAAQLRQISEEIRAEINGCLGAPVVKKIRVRESRPLDPWRTEIPESRKTGVHRGFEA